MYRIHHYCVYILQSSSRRALYIGMTNNLHRRVFEHKMHLMEGFTNDYNATRLVYWEGFDDVYKAIAREKQLKEVAPREEAVADCTIQSGVEGPGGGVVWRRRRNAGSLDLRLVASLLRTALGMTELLW